MDAPRQISLFDAGKAGMTAGMATALAHAGDDWHAKATELFEQWIDATPQGVEFMAEDVRVWAHTFKGLELPPDGRAWGGIFNKASRRGRIKRVGFAPMKSANCHMNPKTVWSVA